MNNFHIHMCESLTPNRRKVLGKNPLDGTNILSTELNRDKILVIAVIAAQEFLLLRGPIPAVCDIFATVWVRFDVKWCFHSSIYVSNDVAKSICMRNSRERKWCTYTSYSAGTFVSWQMTC